MSIHNEAIVECVRVSLPSTCIGLCCRLLAQPAEFMSCPGSSVVEHSSREQSAVGLSPTYRAAHGILGVDELFGMHLSVFKPCLSANLQHLAKAKLSLNSSNITISSPGI